MSQPNPSIPFDFAAAVAQARALYPAQTACVTFIDKTASDAALQFERFLASTSATFRDLLIGQGRDVKAYAHRQITSGGSFAEIDPASGHGVLVLGHAKSTYIKDVSADQMRHHVFAHELGHIVVPNGMYRDMDGLRLWRQRDDYWASIAQTHEWETAADTFSFLHNLRSGTLTPSHIDALTLSDALRFFNSPRSASALEHMTMPGSDAIVKMIGEIDIHGLSPEQITAITQQHARTFAYAPWQAGELYTQIDALHNNRASTLSRIFNKSAAIAPDSVAAPFIARLRQGVADGMIDLPSASRAQILHAAKNAR